MLTYMKDTLKELRHRLLHTKRNSNLGEEVIIKKYLRYIPQKNTACVDIAASDGTTQSNTLFLYARGWGGLAAEFDPGRFAILASHYKAFPRVNLARAKVIPSTIVSLLASNDIPHNFDFLNLDIDSYDYEVLAQLLSVYRPRLICAEINEKIPPPIRFSVTYSRAHYWRGDHFYGQSLSQLYTLCEKYNYKLVELFYNNAFIMPNEIKGPKGLTPREAYRAGYQNKSDRKKKFPYNEDMEPLQTLSPSQAIPFIRHKFKSYRGSYILR